MSTPDDALADLSASLASSFAVSHRPNDTNRPHPRLALYKSHRDEESAQETRRRRILEHQKKRRDDYLNFARALVDGKTDKMDEDDQEEDPEEEDEGMDTSEGKKYRRMRRTYKNQLMESEWFAEIPSDFPNAWTMVMSPVGKRSLVIAGNGRTQHFARSGHFVNQFPSALPGGSRRPPRQRNMITILDCIFSQEARTFFVLDVMMWADHSYYDCDTDFRFFWLQQKLNESPELSQVTNTNPYPFRALPSSHCDTATLADVLNKPLDLQLDGLLFYHRQVHYLPGFTPLVGWLKGYMVPEMLGIDVSEQLMGQMPSDYERMKTIKESHHDYIKQREHRLAKREESMAKREESMAKRKGQKMEEEACLAGQENQEQALEGEEMDVKSETKDA